MTELRPFEKFEKYQTKKSKSMVILRLSEASQGKVTVFWGKYELETKTTLEN